MPAFVELILRQIDNVFALQLLLKVITASNMWKYVYETEMAAL